MSILLIIKTTILIPRRRNNEHVNIKKKKGALMIKALGQDYANKCTLYDKGTSKAY